MGFELKYKRYGENSILIEWPQEIHRSILNDILAFKQKLEQASNSNVISINHAYASLLVIFEVDDFDFPSEVKNLQSVYQSSVEINQRSRKLWKIPVCYDNSFGIDLEFLAHEKQLAIPEIIRRHTLPKYTVYFIGFLPGFLYLGGLDEMLFAPRRDTPRLNIEEGSVAIGGNQTGIYPSNSPGGWHIIGKTPIKFFDVKNETPCFASAGDSVQFYAVSVKTYHDIASKVTLGTYKIESEVLDD